MATHHEGTTGTEPPAPSHRRTSGGKRKAASGASIDELKRTAEVWAEDIRERVDRHPWRALAIALGAGYIVGGGLLTGFTGRLLMGSVRIGLRAAALPVVRDEIYSFLETISADGGDMDETERRAQ